MNLWSMLNYTLNYQPVRIFVTNDYDENIIVYYGTVGEARVNGKVFNHLMENIEHYEYCHGVLVLMTRDKHYNKHASVKYLEAYVKKWDSRKPETRPWRHSIEIKQEIENDTRRN